MYHKSGTAVGFCLTGIFSFSSQKPCPWLWLFSHEALVSLHALVLALANVLSELILYVYMSLVFDKSYSNIV